MQLDLHESLFRPPILVLDTHHRMMKRLVDRKLELPSQLVELRIDTVCVHTCMCACVLAYVRAGVRAGVRADIQEFELCTDSLSRRQAVKLIPRPHRGGRNCTVDATTMCTQMQVDGWMDGRTGEQTDGRTDGRMNGWMDGWMDGWNKIPM